MQFKNPVSTSRDDRIYVYLYLSKKEGFNTRKYQRLSAFISGLSPPILFFLHVTGKMPVPQVSPLKGEHYNKRH
jgi:hypothetical protein